MEAIRKINTDYRIHNDGPVKAKVQVEVLKASEERNTMANQTDSRMSYPMDAIQSAISMADEIGKKIANMEERLADILLEAPPVDDNPSGDTEEQPELRSAVIEKSREMHGRLAACISHLDRLTNRLDL